MADKAVPLKGPEIRSFLGEIADALNQQEWQTTLIIVGGALLAMHGLRDTTMDVDTVSTLDPNLQDIIQSIGLRHGLRLDWLNDNARAFTPQTLDIRDCEVVFDSEQLRVLAPPFQQLFLMKLYRSSAQDFEDMVSMWPQCGFQSPQHVVDQFFQAYPHAPDDTYLLDFIVGIAEAAART